MLVPLCSSQNHKVEEMDVIVGNHGTDPGTDDCKKDLSHCSVANGISVV